MPEFEGPVFDPISFGEEPPSYRDSRGLVLCSFAVISIFIGSSFLATKALISQPIVDAVTKVVQAKKERDIQLASKRFPTTHETPAEGKELPTITIYFPRIR